MGDEAMRGARRVVAVMAAAVIGLTLAGLILVGTTGIGLPSSSQTTAPEPGARRLPQPPTTTTVGPLSPTVAVPTTGGPFWVDCPAARAASVTSLLAGDPGYRAGLDRDGDGVACESPPVTTTTAPTTTTRPRSRLLPPTTVSASVFAALDSEPVPSPPPVTLPSTLPVTVVEVPAGTAEPPTLPPALTVPTVVPTVPLPTVPPPLFGDCNAVIAAGIRVPLHHDDDAWNPLLDVDGDGLACEDDAPFPTTTTTTQVTQLVDCVAAWDFGVAPIPRGSIYWLSDWDTDGDGFACDDDPRPLSAATTTVDNGR